MSEALAVTPLSADDGHIERQDMKAPEDPRVAKLHKHYEETYALAPERSPEVVRLTALGQRLEDTGTRGQIRYRIIHHAEDQAFSLGDTVYLSSGMLARLTTESEVAFVLAHEISHIEGGDTGVSDSSNDPDTVAEVAARLSVTRIREYTSDAKAAEKLDRAGFNPQASQKLFARLSDDAIAKKEMVGFSHGSHKDRQSMQILQMKLKDYESSGTEIPDQKSPEFSEEYLSSLYQPSLSEEIAAYAQYGRRNEIDQRLEGVSSSALLTLHSAGMRVLDGQLGWRNDSERVDMQEVRKGVALMRAADELLAERIDKAFPERSAKEREWLLILSLTEVADNRINDIQDPYDKAQRSGVSAIGREFDYMGRILDSFESPDDFVAFARFANDLPEIEKAGFPPQTRQFPRRMFNLFSGGVGNAVDRFCGEAVRRFYPNPMDYKERFDLVERVAAVWTDKSEYRGEQWTRIQLENVYRAATDAVIRTLPRLDPKFYDENTPEAVKKHAPALVPELIEITKDYMRRFRAAASNAERYEETPWALRGTAYALYSKLPYEEQEKYQASFLAEYERSENPLIGVLLDAVKAKDAAGVLAFTKEHGLKNFIVCATKGGIAREDEAFAASMVAEVCAEFANGNPFASEEDVAFMAEFVRSTRLSTPQTARFLEGKRGKESNPSPETFMFPWSNWRRDFKPIAELSVTKALTFGGDERAAYDGCKRVLDSLDLASLAPSSLPVVFEYLVRYGTGASGGARDYNRPERKLNWGTLLSHPTFTGLRDAYLKAWQGAGVPLKERIAAMRRLSWSMTEFANRQFRDPSENWFGSNRHVAEFLAPLVESVMREFAGFSLNASSVDELKSLHELVGVLDDRRVVSQVRAELELSIVKLMNFEQATAYLDGLLTSAGGDRSGIPVQAIDWYQEHLVRSPQQLRAAEKLLSGYFDRIHKKGSLEMTAVSGFDYVFENFISQRSLEFFEAALESRTDDTKLRTMLADVWYNHIFESHNAFFVRIPTKRNGFAEVFLEGGQQNGFVSYENFVKGFYEALTQNEIDVVLRKLLISREGILMTVAGRRRIHELLMNELSRTPEDEDLHRLLDQASRIGIETVDPAKLYEPLAKLFRERLLLKPATPGSNEDGLYAVWERYQVRVKESGRYYDEEREGETTYERKKREGFKKEAHAWRRDNMPTLEEMRTLFLFDPATSGGSIGGALTALDAAKARAIALAGVETRKADETALSSMDAVLELAKSTGAVGVRFLQLLGQYSDLPEAYRQKFDEVYDQMRGQLKYTAFQTLRREAEKERARPELKAFWNDLVDLSPVLAGGSLMTVYTAKMRDGSERIVKILNPNTESFVRDNVKDFDRIARLLNEESPSQNNELARRLIADLQTWLLEDVQTVRYEENDAFFEDANVGYRAITSPDSSVVVSTPSTVQTGTRYVKVETLVPGKNLSQVIAEDPAKAAPLVKATIESFDHQLEVFGEDGNARVHSDVHIGNVRAGDDGQLYWIDRGYYLEIPRAEAEVVLPLLREGFSAERGMRALQHLFSLPENAALAEDPQKTGVILGAVAAAAAEAQASGKGMLQVANAVILALQRNDVHIPLRVTLLFKNVKALQKMAERVGLTYP